MTFVIHRLKRTPSPPRTHATVGFDDLKGDFVQLQASDGGHQGVLAGWGRGEDGRPYLELRGFQNNPETGGKDVNVKKVYLAEPDHHVSGYEWDRAIIARYDPNDSYRPQREVRARVPETELVKLEITPLSTSDILGRLRLR